MPEPLPVFDSRLEPGGDGRDLFAHGGLFGNPRARLEHQFEGRLLFPPAPVDERAVPASSEPGRVPRPPVRRWSARRRSVAVEAASSSSSRSSTSGICSPRATTASTTTRTSTGGSATSSATARDFSLLAYSYDWRGYSMPLLTHVLERARPARSASSDVTIVRVFGALLAATLGVVVAAAARAGAVPGRRDRAGARAGAQRAALPLLARPLRLPARRLPVAAAARASACSRCCGATPLGYARRRPRPRLRREPAPELRLRRCSPRSRSPHCCRAAVGLADARHWPSRSCVAGALVAVLPQSLINHHQRGSWSPTHREGERADARLDLGRHDGAEVRDVRRPAAEYPRARRRLPRSGDGAPARRGRHHARHLASGHVFFPSNARVPAARRAASARDVGELRAATSSTAST